MNAWNHYGRSDVIMDVATFSALERTESDVGRRLKFLGRYNESWSQLAYVKFKVVQMALVYNRPVTAAFPQHLGLLNVCFIFTHCTALFDCECNAAAAAVWSNCVADLAQGAKIYRLTGDANVQNVD